MATCYRHPTRETGVACSNCGRPICPDCMTPTSVGMRCPECAKQKTRVVRRAYAGGDPVVTYGLIVMNVLVFLGTSIGGSNLAGGSAGGSLILHGALLKPAIHNGELWRLVTSGFLHAGF